MMLNKLRIAIAVATLALATVSAVDTASAVFLGRDMEVRGIWLP